jgi:hypothetical protein
MSSRSSLPRKKNCLGVNFGWLYRGLGAVNRGSNSCWGARRLATKTLRPLFNRVAAVCSRSCRHMREFMCIRGVSDNGESLNLGSFER